MKDAGFGIPEQGMPSLYFSTADMPIEQGAEAWRQLFEPMYEVRSNSTSSGHPGGETRTFLVGDIMVNRTYFTAQHIIRDRRRADTTPDHIVMQFWRTGSWAGEIDMQRAAGRAGTVAVSDFRRTLDTRLNAGDTFGLVIPRTLLDGLPLDERCGRIDPDRTRLIKARLLSLYRQLPHTTPGRTAALRDELVCFVRRILDPSMAADVLQGRELDSSLFALANQVVLDRMADPSLTPAVIAADLQVSRATVYRLFASGGGVMAYVQEQRLLALCHALADPMERRTLTRLAEEYGFSTPAYLSRSFRARFGLSPREWRSDQRNRANVRRQTAPNPFWKWFNELSSNNGA